MSPSFDRPSVQPDASQIDARIKAIASREDKVAFAKQNGYEVAFRKNDTTGRVDVRIRRDGTDIEAFDCSIGNVPRILGLSDDEMESSLAIADLESRYPGLQEAVKQLSDPSISLEGFSDAIDRFNVTHGQAISGTYNVIRVPGSRRIVIKYFKNGSATIEATWRS